MAGGGLKRGGGGFFALLDRASRIDWGVAANRQPARVRGNDAC